MTDSPTSVPSGRDRGRSGGARARPPRDVLDAPVGTIAGVGPAMTRGLAAAGVRTVLDLAFWAPRSYRDYRRVVPAERAIEGGWQVVEGVVAGTRVSGPRRQRRLVVTLAPDGCLSLVWFRAYPGQSGRFPVGAVVVAAGVPARYREALQIVHPDVVSVRGPGEDEPRPEPTVLAIYEAVAGFDQKRLRRVADAAVARVAEALADPIPGSIRRSRSLAGIREAIELLHRPAPLLDAGADLESLRGRPDGPWRRLAYGEAFALGVAVARARAVEAARPAPAIAADPATLEAVARGLGFRMTAAQARAVDAVVRDMSGERPMRRLLQGDVGSGKTAVAVAAVAVAAASGRQAAMLAPTEILAEQHAERLERALGALDVPVTRLSGSLRPRRRRDALRSIALGSAGVVVGTHALLEDPVSFARLGLVVVDEQQRFGVHQRFVLSRAKSIRSGTTPHLLVMTATPIPRTLSLALYGDLDVVTLDEMPPGRIPVETAAFGPDGRSAAYDRVVEHGTRGERTYVICPLVEPSDAVPLPSAVGVHEELSRRMPPGRVALLHGRLLPEEKQRAIARFRSGEAVVLVSTSVVEVGVDVPEASGVLVDGADRFGLSQLHQIRGRVGRAGQRAWCALVRSTDSGAARARVETLAATHDGFRIAEIDLAMRGAGDPFGAKQAGGASLRFADPTADAAVIAEAIEDARAVVEGRTPLSEAETAALDAAVDRFVRSWGATYDEGAG